MLYMLACNFETSTSAGIHEFDLRMLMAALLVFDANSTLPVGLWWPSLSSSVALMESYSDEVLTMTLVFFFINKGSKYFVVK